VTAGRLIDRFGARWPMTAGRWSAALGMLVPYFFHSLAAVYFAGAMNGLSAVLFSLAAQNLVGC
jgi:thiamine transporter ThiT